MIRTRWIDEDRLSIQGDKAKVRREGSEACSERCVAQQVRDASRPKWDSKLEAAYSQYLEALKFAGEIHDFYYHSLVLILPGGQKYTPDFAVYTKQGKPEIHECKGSPKMKNARDGITRLRVAAGTFKCFEFKLVYRRMGQWEITAV